MLWKGKGLHGLRNGAFRTLGSSQILSETALKVADIQACQGVRSRPKGSLLEISPPCHFVVSRRQAGDQAGPGQGRARQKVKGNDDMV